MSYFNSSQLSYKPVLHINLLFNIQSFLSRLLRMQSFSQHLPVPTRYRCSFRTSWATFSSFLSDCSRYCGAEEKRSLFSVQCLLYNPSLSPKTISLPTGKQLFIYSMQQSFISYKQEAPEKYTSETMRRMRSRENCSVLPLRKLLNPVLREKLVEALIKEKAFIKMHHLHAAALHFTWIYRTACFQPGNKLQQQSDKAVLASIEYQQACQETSLLIYNQNQVVM